MVSIRWPLAQIIHMQKSMIPQQWFDDLQSGYLSSGKQDAFYLWKGVWKYPAAVLSLGEFSYGYNAYGMFSQNAFQQPTGTESLGLGGHRTFRNTGTNISLASPAVHMAEVVSPSEMMTISDGFMGGNDCIGQGVDLFGRTIFTIVGAASTKICQARHQGEANVVFCDGHVESPTLQFRFEDTSDAALSRWNCDQLPHREKLST
jgi:prepilin-type processing-associated H-X9-DG protein